MTLRSPVTDPIPLHQRLALSVEDAAKLCGISRSKAYELVNDGTWPFVQMGSSKRIARRALESWLVANEQRKGA